LWKRKAPAKNQDLPGILVGYKWPGTFEQFEEAVEYDELDIFLRRNEGWNPDLDDDYGLTEKPTGVAGAYTPYQMTGQTPSHAPEGSVAQPAVRPGEMDMGEHLSGYGLQGVKVTADDLEELVKSLGLDDKDAKDLVGGLDFSMPAPASAGTKNSSAPQTPPSPPKSQSAPGSSGAHHEDVSKEAAASDGEESDSGSDVSDVGELPPAPRLRPGIQARKRTDERPMVSPLTPSGDSQGESTIQGPNTQPPKCPQPPDTSQ